MAVKNKIIYAVITMLCIYIVIGVFAYFFGGPCASRLYDQAEKAVANNEYPSAIRKFGSAIKLELSSRDKDSAFISELYNARGKAYYVCHKYSEAVADYKRAIDYDTQNTEAKENLNIATHASH